MFKSPPSFWKKSLPSRSVRFFWPLLLGLQKIYLTIVTYRNRKPSHHLPIPVVCVGNLTLGGQGKTPACLALFDLFQKTPFFLNPHFLTRGYGGSLRGPIAVDSGLHSFQQVGDEALLLAQKGPTWKGADRVLSGTEAYKKGASCLILDDGFQNPHLFKDVTLVVIDGTYGFGNGNVFPCGPLRESLLPALRRATGIIISGEDKAEVASLIKGHIPSLPIFQSRLVPSPPQLKKLKNKRLFAFAGIGVPKKFFSMLISCNLQVVGTKSYPDHYPYTHNDLRELLNLAQNHQASLITTRKDLMRIPGEFHEFVAPLDVDLKFEDPKGLINLLEDKFSSSCTPRKPLIPSQSTQVHP